MRIPAEKELLMKKAILKAIEIGESPAQLADNFGVSKSTIYKYRRALRDQGFIKKNENDIYVITENKFSIKPKTPETAKLDLTYEDNIHQPHNDEPNSEIEVHDNNIEDRIQKKLQEIRDSQLKHQAEVNKGFFRKIIDKFKK